MVKILDWAVYTEDKVLLPYNTRPTIYIRLTPELYDQFEKDGWFAKIKIDDTDIYKYNNIYYATVNIINDLAILTIRTIWLGYPFENGNVKILKLTKIPDTMIELMLAHRKFMNFKMA